MRRSEQSTIASYESKAKTLFLVIPQFQKCWIAQRNTIKKTVTIRRRDFLGQVNYKGLRQCNMENLESVLWSKSNDDVSPFAESHSQVN